VCMARGGFRFAAGKPKGRRRAPTFYRRFRIELHTAKWTAPFFCGTRRFLFAYLFEETAADQFFYYLDSMP
jgi:hypothetical protein